MQSISTRLAQSREAMDAALNRSINPDMHLRLLRVYGREACVYYADGLVSADMLQHYVITPLTLLRDEPLPDCPSEALPEAVTACDAIQADSIAEAAEQVLGGRAVLLVDGMPCALGFDARFSVRRGISPPLTESVVLGPHQAFNEAIRDCITLLRRILPTPDLIGEMGSIGDRYPTPMCVMYIKGVVDGDNLSRLRSRLEGVRVDHVLSIGALAQLLEDKPFSLLPQSILTERPDRAASMLLEGQIVILMEGSCQALVLPASLLHLLHTLCHCHFIGISTATGEFINFCHFCFLRIFSLAAKCGQIISISLKSFPNSKRRSNASPLLSESPASFSERHCTSIVLPVTDWIAI